jgi:hypothetical protein
VIETYGVVQIGGAIETLAEAEAFIAKARLFGAVDETPLSNGFLSIEFVGTPEASTTDEGVVQAVLPLTVYVSGE